MFAPSSTTESKNVVTIVARQIADRLIPAWRLDFMLSTLFTMAYKTNNRKRRPGQDVQNRE
jgi:hypothetical protein